MILIDKNSKKSLYLQIYEEIFNQIQEKELTTGDNLIPTRVLAKELGVSRNTVDQAYSQLVLEGLVVSKRGSGYIVAPTNDTQTTTIKLLLQLYFLSKTKILYLTLIGE